MLFPVIIASCLLLLLPSQIVLSAPVPPPEEDNFEIVRFMGNDDSVSRTVKSDSDSDAPQSTPLPPEKEEDDKYVEESEDKTKISEQFMLSEDDENETAPPPIREEDIPLALRSGTIDAKKVPDFVPVDGKAEATYSNDAGHSGGIVKGRKFEEAVEDVIPFDSNDFS